MCFINFMGRFKSPLPDKWFRNGDWLKKEIKIWRGNMLPFTFMFIFDYCMFTLNVAYNWNFWALDIGLC